MLTLLSVNPGYTQGDHYINLLLCSAMCLSPLVLVIRKTRIWMPAIDVPLGSLMIAVIICPVIFHPETVRLTTMLFTGAYCVYLAMLARALHASNMKARGLMLLIKGIVYAFFIVLVIQQLCVLIGIPVFCSAAVYEGYPFKLNSLTAEPSHTSITLCFLVFIYMQTARQILPGYSLVQSLTRDWKLWLAWGWTIFSTVNATAILFAPMALLPFITRKNVWVYSLCAIAATGIISLIPEGTPNQIARLSRIATSTISFDEQKIINADNSISARIIPTIRGAKALTFGTELITGHGVDASLHEIEDIPFDDIYDNGSAGIFNILYNYGLLGAIPLLWAIINMVLIPRRWLTWVTLLMALLLSQEYNMQLLWLVIAYGMVYKINVCKDKTDYLFTRLNQDI